MTFKTELPSTHSHSPEATKYLMNWFAMLEGNSVLNVISTEQPNPNEFQVMPDEPTRMFPVRDGVTIEGPKATNKFWTHWTEKAERVKQEDMAVWPMPYALKWGGAGEHYADEMHIMSRE